MDGVVWTEAEAGEGFEEILSTNVMHVKNQPTLERGTSATTADPGGERKGETP
jgi:hypothetical protein